MDFTFNNYGLILIFFGGLSALVAIFIYRGGSELIKWFAYMIGANAIWSIAYGLELSSNTLEQAMLFINIEYVGITALPLYWFLFCLSFCNKESWYRKKLNMLMLLIFPVITLILIWTNQWHFLYYQDIKMSYEGPFPLLVSTPGLWYYIFTVYFYLLLACGCYLILSKFKSADPVYRKQNYTIIIAALLPWVANLAYLVGIRPFGIIDITPFALIVTMFLLLLGVYRFKLFDIIPIAREKVLELMNDGFLVLDDKCRIIDYNRSFYNYVGISPHKKLIGCAIDDIFPNSPLIENVKSGVSGKLEIETSIDHKIINTEVEILFSNESKVNQAFTIIKLQDLTAARKDMQVAKEQAAELEKLNHLKDRIFSIIAHDLRGPLVNLSEVLKMVSFNQITEEEFKQLTPSLSKDITYTTDLLENMLHWSRSQLDGFGIKKEFFNLRNIVLNEINYHLPAANLKKIDVLHDIFPNEIAYADVLMFQIVVRNILNNAIKFCNEGCNIHITASYLTGGLLNVCIKDNGIGMSAHSLSKLFKGDNHSSRGTHNEKGTGLGLMICKDFMVRNGGDITAQSQLGVGTMFCITVPAKQ